MNMPRNNKYLFNKEEMMTLLIFSLLHNFPDNKISPKGSGFIVNKNLYKLISFYLKDFFVDFFFCFSFYIKKIFCTIIRKLFFPACFFIVCFSVCIF